MNPTARQFGTGVHAAPWNRAHPWLVVGVGRAVPCETRLEAERLLRVWLAEERRLAGRRAA